MITDGPEKALSFSGQDTVVKGKKDLTSNARYG
jgi:hypothetical protein